MQGVSRENGYKADGDAEQHQCNRGFHAHFPQNRSVHHNFAQKREIRYAFAIVKKNASALLTTTRKTEKVIGETTMSIIAEAPNNPCSETEKRCRRCGMCFPATTQYFMRHKKGKNGLHPWCRACYAEYQRNHYADHQEARVEQKRQYNFEHREEKAVKQREYYAEHREDILEYMRTYRDEHREEISAYSKEYYAEHREEHNERVRLYVIEHRVEKREWSRISNHKRRANKKRTGGKYTRNDLAALYELQQGRCCWCGIEMVNRLLYKKLPPDLYPAMFTVDHVVAIERGGTNWSWNIVLACRRCNCSRKHRYVTTEWQAPAPLEWMQSHILKAMASEMIWWWIQWKIKVGNHH
jgi:hypothetical protein